MAEHRYLYINVTSLEGIKPRNGFFFKKRYYAVVSLLVNDTLISTQKTQLGKFQGNNQYTWTSLNPPMRFYVEESKLQHNVAIIMIQLRRKRHYFSKNDEDVGEAYVSLTDLIDKSDDQNDTNKIVVYKVVMKKKKTPPAKVNLTLSYKFSRTYKPCGDIKNTGRDDAVPWWMMRRPSESSTESSYSSPSSGPLMKFDSRLTIDPIYYQSLLFYINSDMY